MRFQAVDRRGNDSAAYFALAWTAAISFVLLLGRSSPDPLLFLPVAVAALPFAAAPRHQVVFRVLAAALLIAIPALRGTGLEGALFAPAAAAMLLSAYRRVRPRLPESSARTRRSRRR